MGWNGKDSSTPNLADRHPLGTRQGLGLNVDLGDALVLDTLSPDFLLQDGRIEEASARDRGTLA